MEEYRLLCKKHGIQFEVDSYETGGAYTTIAEFSDGSLYLNLDKAHGVPFIAAARAEAERLKKIRYAEERKIEAVAAAAQKDAAERHAIENGVVLAGRKYKLVPE